jgi:peptide chain release factor 2
MSIDKEELEKILEIENKLVKIQELEKKMGQPDFWQNRQEAEKVSKKYSQLKELVDRFKKANSQEELEALEAQALLSEKFDNNNAILAISAGTGGVDAQDWAEILLRMYLRFAKNQNWQTQIVDKQAGKEAGIKSATIYLKSNNDPVYGLLKAESGVHRLVRKSPFNAQNLRQTSFALVDVSPEVEEQEVELKESDLNIETFRSSGPGGQSVNTTDSAVRITHQPSGLAVSVQNEKSQLKNKQMALKILSAKIAKRKEEELKKKVNQAKTETQTAKWGNQIRSYIFDPYQMVKDHRTNKESKDVDKVLDGQLMPFIKSYLKKEASK